MRPRAISMRIVFGLILASPAAAEAGNLLVNAGFESPAVATGTFDPPRPQAAGFWYGDKSAIVTAQDGITPQVGNQMLHFINARTTGATGLTSSELFQLVELGAFRGLIASGRAVVEATVSYNRVAGDAETDTEFILEVSAYAGTVDLFPSLFPFGHLAQASALLHSDSDPGTWEFLSIDLPLPASTDFVAVRLGAVENVMNDWSDPEFDGHYGDAAFLDVVEIPEPSVVALLGLGAIGRLRRRMSKKARGRRGRST